MARIRLGATGAAVDRGGGWRRKRLGARGMGCAGAWNLAITLAALLTVGGCSRPLHEEKVAAFLPRAVLVDPLPVTIGVYYAPEFRTYASQFHPVAHSEDESLVPLGPASVMLFDRVLAGMFERVVQVESRPPLSPRAPDLSAVIEPQIHNFKAPGRVVIEYRFTIYEPNGHELASWVVSGRGGVILNATPTTQITDAMASALRSAAAKFVAGFRDEPGVKSWLDRLESVSPGSRP